MGLIGMIIAAVIVAFIIATLVVKFLPLKLKWIVSILLLGATVFLVYKIYGGIMEPIKFEKEKVKRFAKVIEHLKIIRDAEVRYKEVNGVYTDNKEWLVQFIDSGQIALTEVNTVIENVNKGGGIIVQEEKKVTDTIGYEPVLKYFKDRDYKNMFKVPGVEEKEFELFSGEIQKIEGLYVPTFLAQTEKAGILKGMNESLVKQELEAIATDEIKGEFVSVGSLDEVSTAGNWPPSYDKKTDAN
jgi:energy-coupling factor transporter transmembrane protein EcfT